MGSNRGLWSVVAVALVCVAIAWLSTSSEPALSLAKGQARRSYEVESQVYTTPEYRTDATRAIDAYEKLMQRYMDVTERHFSGISTDVKAIATRLDSIDAKLTAFDARLARIEKRLGIAVQAPAGVDPNGPAVHPPEAILNAPVTAH